MLSMSNTKKPVKLSDAELAMIDEGLADLENGKLMSLEEAHDLARKRTEAWLKVTPEDRSA